MTAQSNPVAGALLDTLRSPSENDRELNPANVVDGLFAIARAIHHLANAADRSAEHLDHLACVMTDAADKVAEAVGKLEAAR